LTVDPSITLSIIKQEIAECKSEPLLNDIEISNVNELEQSFNVKIISPIDNEVYKLIIKFDNYKEIPLLIEFVDPVTCEEGTKNAYPSCNGQGGGFFHEYPCICNPCSRKSYLGYSNVHREWNDLTKWQTIPEVGSLKNLHNILLAINRRIRNSTTYTGRMKQL
jgi:hypothetical protein